MQRANHHHKTWPAQKTKTKQSKFNRPQRRFGLDKLKEEDLPLFRLFPRGADPRKPLAYAGPAARGGLADWVREHTGAFIGKKVRGGAVFLLLLSLLVVVVVVVSLLVLLVLLLYEPSPAPTPVANQTLRRARSSRWTPRPSG
jgi:hypothetical protein